MTAPVSPYGHVSRTMGIGREGVHRWAADAMGQAGLDVAVSGEVPAEGESPTLVMLPYQVVMESKAAVPRVALVPTSKDAERESVPAPWMQIARGMTGVLLEHFPERGRRSPGLGPLHPAPKLDLLPKPIAAWYREHDRFLIGKERSAGRLPSVMWRHPFSLAIRFAAFVVDRSGSVGAMDLLRLQALGVLAAGIRMERYVQVTVPAVPVDPELAGLIEAFAAVGGDEGDQIASAWKAVRRDIELAVGLTPHHELTDDDLARVVHTLGIPMQAALVFSIRLSLGAGPELGEGALPHLASVTKKEEVDDEEGEDG